MSTLRIARRSDVAELVELCREHAEYERAAWREYDRTSELEQLLIGARDRRCWVIEGDTELAGFATAALELSTWDAGRYLHMDCLFLRPAYRSRGLGRELMAAIARTAQEWNAINVQWQTPSWNEAAIRFYERLGAQAVPKIRFTLSPDNCVRLAASASR